MQTHDAPGVAGELVARRVLVTGATSGLGLAMAAALARAGATVAVAGKDWERAVRTAKTIPRAIPLLLDVRDAASVRAGVERAWSELGGIDLLVNNAGLGMRTVNPRFMVEPRGFWTVSPEGFRDVLDVNITGYFLVAREVVTRMLEARSGRIVNISISEATMRRRGFVPYGPSRAGSDALSHVMAADLEGTPVRVNLLLPGGATLTGMVPEGERPAGYTFLDPAVMGPPIAWLASREAERAHDERIVAKDFDTWLCGWRERAAGRSS